MSELQKSFAKAKLSQLPPQPAPIFDEREELEDDVNDLPPTSPNDSSSSASSVDSTVTIVPSDTRNLFERPRNSGAKARSTPLPWDDFFAQELYIDSSTKPGLTHHAYLSPPSGNGPLIITHHGAGSSGLSFAVFFTELTKILPSAGIISIDARGHGSTTTPSTLPLDLTLPTLAADLAFVVHSVAERLSWRKLPNIILLGHSLGGAVVTEVAHKALLGTSVLGFGVLDVVEGSAMDALQSMEQYLMTRPTSFPSLASGIEWHTRSRTIRNTTSARVSVPPLLVEPTDPLEGQWLWRTNLQDTKPFWSDWFTGLSSKFLSSSGGKLLILAGTDRLDKELMIGQMQGKYQLQVFPEAGHFVQEDQPAKTAMVVADFFKRNDRTALVLPPKVDDLIRQGKLKGRAK